MKANKTTNKKVKLLSKAIIYIILIMILVLFAIKGFAFGVELFSTQGVEQSPGQDVVITIPEGANTSTVGNVLLNAGLIENKNTFGIQCKFYEASFYAGDYTLNTSMGAEEIIEKLKIKPGSEEGSTQAKTQEE